MKKILFAALLTLIQCKSFCGDPVRDSLIHELSIAKTDSSRFNILYSLMAISNIGSDSVFYYATSALRLAQQLGDKEKEIDIFFVLNLYYAVLGNTTKAVEMDLKGLDIAEQTNNIHMQANFYYTLGKYYHEAKDYDQSLQYILRSYSLYESEEEKSQVFASMSLNQIGDIYFETGRLDSAQYFNTRALKKWNDIKQRKPDDPSFINNQFIQAEILYSRAGIESEHGNYSAAILDLKESLKNVFDDGVIKSYSELARVFVKMDQVDSAIVYANQSLLLGEKINNYHGIAEAGNLLAVLYKQINPQQVILYQQKVIAANDSAISRANVNAIRNLVGFDEQQRQYEIDVATATYQNKVKLYTLLSGVGVLLLIAFILYFNNRQKQKSNKVLQATLTNLKSAQAQLIQSEKMASLGELTAGIAHEIQNPLNFVNNFSEVNKELVDELRNELKAGNAEEAIAISNDIRDNEEKINHHGKRADAIVKGMLLHSRKSEGVREPTDINALCDEYLRLAYHGLRAKDNSFNAEMKTDFDNTIGKINIVPQDIGRVLLNLYNNAFYALNEKRNQQPNGYKPTIFVATKRVINTIEIMVKDNGNGIPPKIADKIFQPFFTTKPTGQGTGLGLSLSYDIIKVHGGELKMDSKEGEETVFIITLPIS